MVLLGSLLQPALSKLTVMLLLTALRPPLHALLGIIWEKFWNALVLLYPLTRSSVQDEAMAVREACIFNHTAGIVNVLAESDYSMVVGWFSSYATVPHWDCASIIYVLAQNSALFCLFCYELDIFFIITILKSIEGYLLDFIMN